MNKIEIDGKKYQIDLERAISAGLAKEIRNYPLRAGDVYSSKDKGWSYNPILLVRVAYSGDKWQLLGIGASPNSGVFYNEVHTIKEIEALLIQNDLIFVKNIDSELSDLVRK